MYLNLSLRCLMFTKFLSKLLVTCAIASSFTSVYAYELNEKFSTKHFAVYEVVLGKNEVFNESLKYIIAKDAASHNKYQTTSVVFPYRTQGLNSTINEPVLGIITTESYEGKNKTNIAYDDSAKTASYAGIYMTFKQLSKIADNKSSRLLIEELVNVPMVISDIPLSIVSKNFNKNLFYTASSNALVFDFQVIDSVYYKMDKLEKVNADKCTVSVLAIADRSVIRTPYFISAHGAVNNINCRK